MRVSRRYNLLPISVVAGLGLLVLKRERRRRAGRPGEVLAGVSRGGRFREAILVVNPNVRRAAGLDRARDELARSGIAIVDEISVEAVERLEDYLLERPGCLLVIVAGGDGTVSGVAEKLAGSRVAMAILPFGTANDFARSLGIPMNITEAVRLINEGRESKADLGRLHIRGRPPRHFVHAAMVGMSTGFARLATRASVRSRLGRFTYLVCGVVALWRRRPFHCRLTFDGRVEDLELLQLSVVNAPVFGGFLGIRVRGSNLNDRALDVLTIENIPLRKLALAGLFSVARRKKRRIVAGIRTIRVERVHVEACQPLVLTLDGEIAGHLPARFEVAGQALRVIVPPASKTPVAGER